MLGNGSMLNPRFCEWPSSCQQLGPWFPVPTQHLRNLSRKNALYETSVSSVGKQEALVRAADRRNAWISSLVPHEEGLAFERVDCFPCVLLIRKLQQEVSGIPCCRRPRTKLSSRYRGGLQPLRQPHPAQADNRCQW